MTKTFRLRTIIFGSVALALILGMCAILWSVTSVRIAKGATGNPVLTRTLNGGFLQTYTFFTATTTTATSTTAATASDPGYLVIGGASDVIFYFSRGDVAGHGNSGSTRFAVQVTPDGVNWFDYNELGQVVNTIDANGFFTRVGTSTISAATSTLMYAMEDISYYGVRCIANKVTDGEASCKATATYP